MKKVEIIIKGEAYPCRQTMGAMLRFKRETGKEVTDMDGGLSDMCTYLWCCVVSASKADGKSFNLSLMEFADLVEPDDLSAWTESLKAEQSEEQEGDESPDGEKKS